MLLDALEYFRVFFEYFECSLIDQNQSTVKNRYIEKTSCGCTEQYFLFNFRHDNYLFRTFA